MFILGLTGGIGSGKTAATMRFSSHGITVVDADIIAHQVVQAGSSALEKITEHFGTTVLLPNGELDRKKLRDIIFKDGNEREWLESYLHPIIRENIMQAIEASSSRYTILSAPLLIEKKLDHLVDRLLVIDCPEALQIHRACERDNSSIESIQHIMQQQVSRRERLSKADDVIVNDDTLEILNHAIDQYHHALINELNLRDQQSNQS